MFIYYLREFLPTILLSLLVLSFIVFLIRRYLRKELSRWGHLLQDIQVPIENFYATLEKKIKEKGLKEITIGTTFENSSNVFIDDVQYLRVRYKGYVTYISCIHVGKGSHITSWTRHQAGFFKSVISSIPILGQILIALFDPITYYRYDVAEAHATYIHHTLTDFVDEILKQNEITALSPSERALIRNPRLRRG